MFWTDSSSCERYRLPLLSLFWNSPLDHRFTYIRLEDFHLGLGSFFQNRSKFLSFFNLTGGNRNLSRPPFPGICSRVWSKHLNFVLRLCTPSNVVDSIQDTMKNFPWTFVSTLISLFALLVIILLVRTFATGPKSLVAPECTPLDADYIKVGRTIQFLFLTMLEPSHVTLIEITIVTQNTSYQATTLTSRLPAHNVRA